MRITVSMPLGTQGYDPGALPFGALQFGGPGSGNWAHAGRKGQVGGSAPRDSGMSLRTGKDWLERYEKATGKPYNAAQKQGKGEGAGFQKADGIKTQAFGNDPNKKYDLQTRVVSLRSLITSNTASGAVNPDYDQSLQPRARDRAASQAQIDNVARNLVPESLLWDFHALDKGTPIVGDDGMVESGNGRTLALMRAKELYPERWAAYQELLQRSLGEYGLSAADIEGIEDPVIVRVRADGSIDRAAFTKEANSAAVLGMSPLEQAAQDAKILNENSLTNLTVKDGQSIDEALRAPANQSFIKSFVGDLPQNERAVVMRSDGTLNRMGIWRLKAALFRKVFPGDAGARLADTFLESLDSNIKNFENAVGDIMPKLARAESLIASGQRGTNLSMAGDFAKSIDMLARLKEIGMPVGHYLRQTTLFERELTPRQEQLLGRLDTVSRSRKDIRDMFERYADAVINAPDPRQGGLFGSPELTIEQLMAIIMNQ